MQQVHVDRQLVQHKYNKNAKQMRKSAEAVHKKCRKVQMKCRLSAEKVQTKSNTSARQMHDTDNRANKMHYTFPRPTRKTTTCASPVGVAAPP